MKILLHDADAPDTRFSGRIFTPFGQRDGAFTVLERLALEHPGADFAYFHADPRRERLGAAMLGVAAARAACGLGDGATLDQLRAAFDKAEESAGHGAPAILARLGAQITNDFFRLSAAGWPKADTHGLSLVGPAANLVIHASAEILPGVVFDLREGPVIISAGVRISPFSYLKGPVFVGEGAWVDSCRLDGPVAIGRKARVGGEIGASIVGDFSNKHHEGFLGHSIVGRWVNIGALATTSDLKNNYGTVKLRIPADPFGAVADTDVSTGRQKFGSIIADCAKIGILLPLSTGSVVDFGANLFGAAPGKYTPMFAWGGAGESYDVERFLKDCATIFARRGEGVTPAFVACVRHLWESRPARAFPDHVDAG